MEDVFGAEYTGQLTPAAGGPRVAPWEAGCSETPNFQKMQQRINEEGEERCQRCRGEKRTPKVENFLRAGDL